MRELASTTLGRLALATGVLGIAVAVLNIAVLRSIENPSWVISVLAGSLLPLVVVSNALSYAARGQLIRRDSFTIVAALLAVLSMSATDVADDQHLAIEDALFSWTAPLLGVMVGAFIWSMLGRAGDASRQPR